MAPRKHKFVIARNESGTVVYYLNGNQVEPCGLIGHKDKAMEAALKQYGIEVIEANVRYIGDHETLKELEAAIKEKAEAQKNLEELTAKRDALQEQYDKLESEIYDLDEQIGELEYGSR